MKLTRRQTQIIELLEQGKKVREIAADLGLSEHTVRVHMHRLYKVLGVHTRTTAVIAWRESSNADLIPAVADLMRYLKTLGIGSSPALDRVEKALADEGITA